jgi:hypothetical protein
MKTITVNGRSRDIPDMRKISHDQLQLLVYGPVGDREGFCTVTYSNGPRWKPSGSLTVGESVTLNKNIRFTVVRTDKA